MTDWRALALLAWEARRFATDLEDAARFLDRADYDFAGRFGDRVVGYLRPGRGRTTHYFVFDTRLQASFTVVSVDEPAPGSPRRYWDAYSGEDLVDALEERGEDGG